MASSSQHLVAAASYRCQRWQAWPAVLVGLVTFLAYGAVSVVLFNNFRSGMDLAIFDQAVRNLSHFRVPVSSMKSPGMNLWGDHFHPILVIAAPFYWIWDDPRALLLVQALMIGLTASIIVLTARCLYFPTRLGEPLSLGTAFAASFGVAYGAVFDFHEVALGMPILAVGLAALLADRRAWFAVACGLLLLVKEDAGIIVFGLGLVAFLRGLRKLGGWIMAVSALWTVLVIKVIIPVLSPTGAWLYSSSMGGAGAMLRAALRAFVTDGGLTMVLVWIVLAFLGLPLRSPILWALLPNIATRAISPNVNYWTIHNHYNLLPTVIVAFAAMETLGTKVRRTDIAAKALLVLAGIAFCLGPALRQTYHAIFDSRAAGARQILQYIPDGASVAADAYLAPHLTKNHSVTQQIRPATLTGWPAYRDDLGRPLVADYLVFDQKSTSNMSTGEWTGPAIEYFEQHGFKVTRRVGEYVLMQKAK